MHAFKVLNTYVSKVIPGCYVKILHVHLGRPFKLKCYHFLLKPGIHLVFCNRSVWMSVCVCMYMFLCLSVCLPLGPLIISDMTWTHMIG